MFLRKKNLFNKKEDFYNKITDYFTSINTSIDKLKFDADFCIFSIPTLILYQSLNTK